MKRKFKSFKRISAFSLTILLLISAVTIGFSASADVSAITTFVNENTAPITENLEFETFRNIAVSGSFSAVDPEGDQITFEICTQPKKGSVEIYDDGTFTYTPSTDKKGKDSFTYTACDTNGNVSNEASVKIQIKKQSTDVCYSDMQGNQSHYAALCLAENGIFTGEKLGDEYFFRPTQSIMRGEYLALCLRACNIEIPGEITQTSFWDDNEIPKWEKPYITTAVMAGIVTGYKEGTQYVFSANTPITFAEAAVITDNILNITDVSVASSKNDSDCPVWASQATANLTACNVIPSDSVSVYKEELTRADAADMLLGMMDVIGARGTDVSLLNWAQ